jgi:hypothetical protein
MNFREERDRGGKGRRGGESRGRGNEGEERE